MMQKIEWHMPDLYKNVYMGYASSKLTNAILRNIIDYLETLVHKRRI